MVAVVAVVAVVRIAAAGSIAVVASFVVVASPVDSSAGEIDPALSRLSYRLDWGPGARRCYSSAEHYYYHCLSHYQSRETIFVFVFVMFRGGSGG